MLFWPGTLADSLAESCFRGGALAPFLLGSFFMTPLRRRRGPAQNHAGFSLAELTVILAVIGTLLALSIPAFVSYYRTAQVRAAASVIATYINQGRQLAIQRNQSVCVHIWPDRIHYHLNNSCTGARWVGPGTDANGELTVPNEITPAGGEAAPVFSNLGAAAPATTVTVSNGSYSLNVTVSASGRVTIGP